MGPQLSMLPLPTPMSLLLTPTPMLLLMTTLRLLSTLLRLVMVLETLPDLTLLLSLMVVPSMLTTRLMVMRDMSLMLPMTELLSTQMLQLLTRLPQSPPTLDKFGNSKRQNHLKVLTITKNEDRSFHLFISIYYHENGINTKDR